MMTALKTEILGAHTIVILLLGQIITNQSKILYPSLLLHKYNHFLIAWEVKNFKLVAKRQDIEKNKKRRKEQQKNFRN